MTEASSHIEFVIGEEKRLSEIVGRTEIEPLLRSALGLGLSRVALLDEDELPLVVLGPEPDQAAPPPVHQRRSVLVEGEPRGTLVLEAVWPLPGFEAIGRLLQDTVQLTVTNNLKRMLTTELHTSVVQESYEQLVATNRRLMESEGRYRELARTLEKKVAERTAELQAAHNRLLQQEKLAAVGQLAAGMAHEINTPLGFIRSNLHSFAKYRNRMAEMLETYRQLLEEEGVPPSLKQRAEQCRRDLKLEFLLADSSLLLSQSQEGADRIALIVAQLKGFAHLDGLAEQPMDLAQELKQLLAGLAPQFPPGTRLTVELPPLPPVVCRVPLVMQAFANILDNALKSRQTGLEVTVSATLDGGWVTVCISDNGCGIPPAQLPRVFDPFFTTRPVGSGVGMGLTVAREAIVGAGGSIEISSAVGQGTCCRVILPQGGTDA